MTRYFWTENASAPITVNGRTIPFTRHKQFGGQWNGFFVTGDFETASAISERCGPGGLREITSDELDQRLGLASAKPAPKPISKEQRKERAMKETSKAMRRRRCEEASGGFKWSEIFKGNGIDVGSGDDPIQIPGCKGFDIQDGDANHLSRYIAKESLDYLHASQSLEHMVSARAALLDWAVCVKPGGYLVVTVPSWTLYEKQTWPSRFNNDHKSAWSMEIRAARNCPVLVHIPTFVADMERHGLKALICRLVDTNFDHLAPDTVDQTLPEDSNVECFYEFVFQKS